MIELVLDASVVIKWFRDVGERHVYAARALRRSFEAGDVRVFVPPLIDLEIINVAARRWGWRAIHGRCAARRRHVGEYLG